MLLLLLFWGFLPFLIVCFCLFLFVMFVCVEVFLLFLCFLVMFFGLLLFCSLCLLEWSRRCSCLVLLWCVLFVFVFCSGSCFVCFLFQDIPFFLFFYLLSCFVLNHHIRSSFALHLLFMLLLFFRLFGFGVEIFFDFWLPIKTSLEKLEIPTTPKMKNAEKMDILTGAVSTSVFTNAVFLLLSL